MSREGRWCWNILRGAETPRNTRQDLLEQSGGNNVGPPGASRARGNWNSKGLARHGKPNLPAAMYPGLIVQACPFALSRCTDFVRKCGSYHTTVSSGASWESPAMRRISPNVPVNAGQAWHNVIKRPGYAHQGICSRAPEFALHHDGSKYRLQEEPSPKTRSGGQHETMLGASAAQWCKGEGTTKDSSASKAQQQNQQNTAAQPAKTQNNCHTQTYKPYSSAISVFASAFATHENPTHPPKPPTTGQNPQQPVNKKNNNPTKL